MLKKLFRIVLLLLMPLLGKATHEVSGYITFQHLTGNTYRIRVFNYANTCNDAFDQDTITIHFGDGTSALVPRRNGPVIDGFPEGVPVCDCRKLCIYDTTHTYPGPSHYRIFIDDAARMANISNMFNSVGQNFYIYNDLVIDPFVGFSTAPIITNPPVCIYACPGQCYTYNPGAYSPMGDSLVYNLGQCLGRSGVVAQGYTIPPVTTVDPATGTLTWCSPPGSGIYNFVINIITYRKTAAVGGRIQYRLIDTMECELEIIVSGSCNDSAPKITGITDTCVVAGDVLHLSYTAREVLSSDSVSIAASGDPFLTSPAATTNSPAPHNPVTLNFTWATTCNEVRKSPYQLLVTATDDPRPPFANNNPLNSYMATNIFVVGPAPTNLKAKVLGNSVSLHWNPDVCTDVTGYSIYRHTGCYKWIHGPCETGVPSYTGYVYIASTSGINDTTYIDNNNGVGLVPGVSYDYMVVANFPVPDQSVSYASNDTCVKLNFDVPIITNVSVDNTATSGGTIFVKWIKPPASPADFDTITNPGPYKYVLLRATGISGLSFTPIDSVLSPYFNSAVATTYMDHGLNTLTTGYNYRMSFYSSNNTYQGSSDNASSIYLVVKPDDNKLHLSWNSHVPWADSTYSIYRTFPLPVTFLATVPGTQHTYTDSGLTDLKTFCYYVESKSYYFDTAILHPLFDSSEVMCGTPKDTIPPCPPNFSANALCDEYRDSLVWNNPDYTCPKVKNRILYYNVYFTPAPSSELNLVATIYNLKDTVFVRDSLASIAGCFGVTAVDSFMNQSPIDTICVDNCPLYVLPNIFTPNGDGINDLFTPILPYRFIKDVDIEIFNRWGAEVFHTLDPMINWNGKEHNTGADCSDGVYFYICQVHEIHIDGIRSRMLKGFVQLLR